MKRLLIFTVALFFLSFQAVAQDAIKIRVADFPPNYFKDDSGKWAGLSVELAEAIVKASGFEPEFVELPWSRALVYLKTGHLHYMTNLYKTDERSTFLHWIGPVRISKMGLIVHRDYKSLPIVTLDDFVPVCSELRKKFGIQNDFVYPDIFKQRLKDDQTFANCFESVAMVDSNLKKAAYKRIIGFFESIPSMQYRFQTDPNYADLTFHSFVLTSDDVFHGFSKKAVSPDMFKKFRTGYAKCLEDGTIQRILKKWNVQ